MNKAILIIFLTITGFQVNINAQNKDEFYKWVKSVEDLIPEIDQTSHRSTYRSGSVDYNRIRFNLLSDKFFVPVFGVPFNKLSYSKRKSMENKLRRYNMKGKLPWVKRLDWYLWGALTQQRAHEKALKESNNINDIRRDFNALFKLIDSEQISYSQLIDEENRLDYKYKWLLKSERETLIRLIDSKKPIIASVELEEGVKKLKDLEYNYSTLQRINTYISINYRLYTSSSASFQSHINKQVKEAKKSVLQRLMKDEISHIKGMSIKQMNAFKTDFSLKYNQNLEIESVQSALREILNSIEESVIEEYTLISNKIKDSKGITELYSIERDYLRHVTKSDKPKIIQLVNQLQNRRSQIREEKEKERKEAALKKEQAKKKALNKLGPPLSTGGLINGVLINLIFEGQFKEIKLKRDDEIFLGILSFYMYAEARKCKEYLNENSVEIMKNVCARERVTKNGWGTVTSRDCIEWDEVGTGLYTSDGLYQAYVEVDRIIASKMIGDFWGHLMKVASGEYSYNDLAYNLQLIKDDMEKFVKLNECRTASIKRFEDNLIRFALNKPPILLVE